MECPQCGLVNPDANRFCGNCGAPFTIVPVQSPTSGVAAAPTMIESVAQIQSPPLNKTLEERRRVLAWGIQNYLKLGFQVLSQTETTAQLIKPRRIESGNVILCVLLFFSGIGIPILLLYLVLYLNTKPEGRYKEVDQCGALKVVNT